VFTSGKLLIKLFRGFFSGYGTALSLVGLRVENDNDLARRRRHFGSNTVPTKRSRMFLYFIWEATQDMTLIILILAAIASFGLSFYEPPPSDKNFCK